MFKPEVRLKLGSSKSMRPRGPYVRIAERNPVVMDNLSDASN
jgi:hypothetical protein